MTGELGIMLLLNPLGIFSYWLISTLKYTRVIPLRPRHTSRNVWVDTEIFNLTNSSFAIANLK